MTATWYALVVAAVGLFLWLRGSVIASVIAVLFFSLFGGGAAFTVGRSSITPASFALVFLLAHVLLTMFRTRAPVALGLRTNGYLAWYCLYGVAMAVILPKLFAGVVSVPPVSGGGAGVHFAVYTLHYSVQNITAAVYLFGALVLSICAGAASADPRSRDALVRWAIIIAWLHVGFGVAGAALSHSSGASLIKLFRNATYQELSQMEAGVTRISGIFPEPAAYAGFAFGWFALATELWLRNVSPRLTLVTAVALALMVIASTSTSGYLALAGYGVILLARFIIAPRGLRASKAVAVGFTVLTVLCAALAAVAFVPSLAGKIGRIASEITVGKAETLSGRERLFQAAAAFKAFGATWGIGIGPGSFRSSSLLLAILGSTGVVGLAAFFGHVLKILRPFSVDTYRMNADRPQAIAQATAWAACVGLIPAMVSAPTAAPGYVFAVLGGLALGWRDRAPPDLRVAAMGRRINGAALVAQP